MVKTIYMTVFDYWEEKKEELMENIFRKELYEKMVGKYFLGQIGTMRISEVGLSDMERVMRAMCEDGRSTFEAHLLKGITRRFFHMAVQDRLIPENPADSLPVIRVEHMELRMLTEEDEIRLLRAFRKTRYGELYALLMITGVRFRELRACRICDFREEEKCLEIHQVVTDHGTRIIPRKWGPRQVPLTEDAVHLFRQAIQKLPEQQRGMENLIFADKNGKLLQRSPKTDLKIIRRESGWQEVNAQMLENLYGMRAVAMGVNTKALYQYLGYRKPFFLDRFFQAAREQKET